MKRLHSTAALFFLLASSAFAVTAQEEQQIVDQTLAVFGKTPFVLPDSVPVHRLCGTSIIMDAKQRFNELSPQAQAALRPFLYPRPTLQKSYDPPSGRFRIHYDTAGAGAVRYASTRNAQGVPVWVDTLGMVLDSIWDKEVIQMGFFPPVSDGFYTPNGGDGRFDVYLDELGGAILGYTAPDSVGFGPPYGSSLRNQATAFMVLDNDYIGIPGYTTETEQRQVLRVTAAHEFFHAIQFAYNYFGFETVGGNPMFYWQEATAVWMEDQVYNEINDYVQYLPFWFSAPELSFRSFSNNFGGDPYRAYRPYALAIYGHYLSRRFPNPSYGYSVVRRVWGRMATVSGFNLFAAIDFALGSESSNFLSSLQEFYRWNYFVGAKVPINAPDTLYGNEAAIWPTFNFYHAIDSIDNYPTRSQYFPCTGCSEQALSFFHSSPCGRDPGPPCIIQCTPSKFIPYTTGGLCIEDLEDLGASYLKLQNPGGGSLVGFALVSDTGRPAPWLASAAGYNTNSRTYTFLGGQATDPSGGIPEFFFPDFGNYTEIAVMVMNSELLTSGAVRQNSAYAYSANVDSAAPPSVTNIRDGRPNPFRPEIDKYVKFPVVLDSLSGTWDITLIVFHPSGEVVCKKEYEKDGGYTYRETVVWYGRNGNDEKGDQLVASGIYFCKIVMKEKGTSRKVEKVSKIALIRQ